MGDEDFADGNELLEGVKMVNKLLSRALKKAILEHGPISIRADDLGIDGAPEFTTFSIADDGELDMQP